jgi:hypothetical protein
MYAWVAYGNDDRGWLGVPSGRIAEAAEVGTISDIADGP